MLAVRYAPEIEGDLVAATSWYVRQRPDLGEEFLNDFQATGRLIATSGAAFRCVVQDYRRLHLRNFPYAGYFVVSGELAMIYLVIHVSRDPSLVDQVLGERR